MDKEEGEAIKWDLFHLAFHKGVVDPFSYDLGMVYSNHGITRNRNERRDSPKPVR